jgi:hypothetical protein
MVEQPLTLGEADDWRRRLHGVETDNFENRGAIARRETVCAERHVYIAEQLKRISSSIRFIGIMLLIVSIGVLLGPTKALQALFHATGLL